MSDSKSHRRLDHESDQMWAIFKIYRDLGEDRCAEHAYYIYMERSGKSKARVEKARSAKRMAVSGSVVRWRRDNHWDDRCREWDLDEETRLRKITHEHDEKKYIEEISEFRELQVDSGKKGVQIALKIKNDLAVFLKMAESNAQTRLISTLREAEQMARILNMVEGKSSDQWSRGLLLNELIAQLEGDSADRA
jgi:hypothetical protein